MHTILKRRDRYIPKPNTAPLSLNSMQITTKLSFSNGLNQSQETKRANNVPSIPMYSTKSVQRRSQNITQRPFPSYLRPRYVTNRCEGWVSWPHRVHIDYWWRTRPSSTCLRECPIFRSDAAACWFQCGNRPTYIHGQNVRIRSSVGKKHTA